jgi:hypothetical protein
MTFPDIKARGTDKDVASAARALGHALFSLQSVNLCDPALTTLRPSPVLHAECLSAPLLQKRLGADNVRRLREWHGAWSPTLSQICQQSSLVHGDFNNSNTLF